MFGRTFSWVIGLLAGLAVLGTVAVLAFQAGQATVPAVVPAAGAVAGAVPVYVGHVGWGFGFFGFLGFLFPLFFILLLVFALRGGRRGWGPGPSFRGGWTDYRGGDPNDPRRRWIEDLHRDLHETERKGSDQSATGTDSTTGSTR
jgi:hypothetical protein